jgi:adenylate cyclase
LSLLRSTAFRLALLTAVGFAALRFSEIYDSFSRLPILSSLDHALGDLRFRERLWLGRARPPTRVVIAAADERSVDQIGVWPWRRELYGLLIDRLTEAGAQAIVFDVAFLDQGAGGSEADRALAESIHRSGRTVQSFVELNKAESAHRPTDEVAKDFEGLAKAGVGPPIFVERIDGARRLHPLGKPLEPWGDPPTVRAPVLRVVQAATWFGYFNAEPDNDGVIRSAKLLTFFRDGSALPSIDLAGAALACGVSAPVRISPVAPAAGADRLSAILLDCAGDELSLPVRGLGEMTLDYEVPFRQVPTLSVSEIIQAHFKPEEVRGKVMVVAGTAQGTFDLRSTPLDPDVPGVVTHVAAIEQILGGRHLQRPTWLGAVELLGILLLGLLFGWLFSWIRPLLVLPLTAVGLAGIHFATLGGFLAGYDLTPALPSVELLALGAVTVIARYFTDEKEKRSIRSAFRYYLTPSVMDAVLANPGMLKLGGEKRELTVLFSDIRGFTSLSEQMAPERLVALLNGYLTPMTDIVFENGGTLDKYMGDSIMAFYGAPLAQPDHALRASRTALGMLDKLEELRVKWRAEDLPELAIGIGICSGPMVVGNMGSQSRFDYTVMGDAVNLGSRLEGANKTYGTRVILAETTLALLAGQVTARSLDIVRVKGKRQSVRIYELLSIGPPPPGWAELLPLFEQGIAHYRAREWQPALACFVRVANDRGADGPTLLYVQRCRTLLAAPPADGWDGVSDLMTK